MNHPLLVQVGHALQHLQRVVLHLGLGEALAAPQEVHERLRTSGGGGEEAPTARCSAARTSHPIVAHFQDDVNVARVLEEVQEAHDASVAQRLVDLDLAQELLLGALLLQAALHHHLARHVAPRPQVAEEVALGEAALRIRRRVTRAPRRGARGDPTQPNALRGTSEAASGAARAPCREGGSARSGSGPRRPCSAPRDLRRSPGAHAQTKTTVLTTDGRMGALSRPGRRRGPARGVPGERPQLGELSRVLWQPW